MPPQLFPAQSLPSAAANTVITRLVGRPSALVKVLTGRFLYRTRPAPFVPTQRLPSRSAVTARALISGATLSSESEEARSKPAAVVRNQMLPAASSNARKAPFLSPVGSGKKRFTDPPD